MKAVVWLTASAESSLWKHLIHNIRKLFRSLGISRFIRMHSWMRRIWTRSDKKPRIFQWKSLYSCLTIYASALRTLWGTLVSSVRKTTLDKAVWGVRSKKTKSAQGTAIARAESTGRDCAFAHMTLPRKVTVLSEKGSGKKCGKSVRLCVIYYWRPVCVFCCSILSWNWSFCKRFH